MEMMMGRETVLKTWVCLPFNHLTWLLTWEGLLNSVTKQALDYINFRQVTTVNTCKYITNCGLFLAHQWSKTNACVWLFLDYITSWNCTLNCRFQPQYEMFSVQLLYLNDMTTAAKNNVPHQPRTFYNDVTNSVTCWRSLLILKPVMGTECCKMWHYHCTVDKSLLVCNTLSLGQWFLLNGRIMLLHLQRSSGPTSLHRTTWLANDSVMNLWNRSPCNTCFFQQTLILITYGLFPLTFLFQVTYR